MAGTWGRRLLRHSVRRDLTWCGNPQTLSWNCSHFLERKAGLKKSAFSRLWNRSNERSSLPIVVFPMRIAMLATDGREMLRSYQEKVPTFGTAPQALIKALAAL